MDLFSCKTVEEVKYLLEHKADVNVRNEYGETPLFGCRSAKVEKLLIDFGADVDAVTEIRVTPLHNYINEDIEVIKVVVKAKADLTILDEHGRQIRKY